MNNDHPLCGARHIKESVGRAAVCMLRKGHPGEHDYVLPSLSNLDALRAIEDSKFIEATDNAIAALWRPSDRGT